METKIIRSDTGLDFKRIEQLIKLFYDKSSKERRVITQAKNDEIKNRSKDAFVHFGLSPELDYIAEIDKKIEELKEKRAAAESRIRDFTQGIDSDKRYSSYDTVREGSPIYAYVHQGEENYKEQEKRLSDLDKGIIEELWLARDIVQAVEIYQRYSAALENKDS